MLANLIGIQTATCSFVNSVTVIFVSATDEDFYSSLAQMAGDGFDDDDDPDEVIILVEL